jgi:choline-sulfatase
MQCDYDDEVTFRAVRHLHDLARRSTADPFLLVVSFSNPHDPWEVPRRYWDLHDETRVPLPRVAKIPLSQADPHSRRLREMCGIDEVHLSEQQIRQARHGYYAAISYVDERIGAVLAALRETGLDEMTTVVFTADHGEMLGERGLWYKMALFEPAARVPLIIRRAGGLGDTRVREPVSLLDVAPTLLELAGASREELDELGLDGSSLAGARDAPAPVIGEYSAEGVTAPMAMLRAGVHKLIVCPGDPAQLFDLRADPDELRNLAEHPHGQAIVAELLAALERRVDLVEIERRVLASQADRRLVNRGMSRGPSASWDYEPRVDSSMKYVRTRSDLYDLQRRARLESDGGADLA